MSSSVRTSATAIVSLVFGILTWVFLPFIGALIAVICGHAARGEIRRATPGTVDGEGLAVAGMILGYVQLGICLLAIVIVAGVLMLALGAAGWH
jgi:hypothetical protein